MKKMKWGALLVCLLAVMMSIQVFSAQSVMPLAGKTILVDSGHGGKDDGAQRGEVKEDAINLAIAMEVRKQLIEQGANVLMTREDDRDLAEEDSENRKRDDMKKRVEFIECGFCDMFVSIHLNAPTAASGALRSFTSQTACRASGWRSSCRRSCLPAAVSSENRSRAITTF